MPLSQTVHRTGSAEKKFQEKLLPLLVNLQSAQVLGIIEGGSQQTEPHYQSMSKVTATVTHHESLKSDLKM
jgi:hypothetical protein